MNKAQRKRYLLLNDIDLPRNSNPSLCIWCQYADWPWTVCSDIEVRCLHPSLEVRKYICDITSGYDCQGFRPAYEYNDCVDIVGIWLRGESPDWIAMNELIKEGKCCKKNTPAGTADTRELM